ncbi:MFS transporter [Amycolatopsis sp. NBRC 101858]|uniref:MFS transporter n=1 Tax=Amycolatopsis sp. NBRC 101858 TaxID=3032200 RepID=UPI0024A51CF9|nr:MFS transporter [Amycolatopsis sp. NBRC 101858]GLY38906.1 MFS transporter [Amycolatopsis sp. NBRC 101858]
MATLPDESDKIRATDAPVGVDVTGRPTLRPAGLRRLLVGMTVTNFLLCVLWAAVGVTLLALQIQKIDPAGYVGSLGLVLAVGAIGSMISGPIMGAVSDRVRSRLGARVPVMLAGAVLTLVLTILMGSAGSIGELVVLWFLMQFVTVGCISTSMYANLPDRVPVARRGMFSSSLGVAALVGATAGQAFGSSFASAVFAGYLIIGVALLVGVVLLALVGAQSNIGQPKKPVQVVALLRTFWVSPRKHPDFAWTFAARFMLYSGYFLVSGYVLYTLQDYVGLGTEGAVRTVPVVGVATLAGVLVSTPVAGFLVDRFGRTKPILVIVATVLAIGSLVPLFAPTVGGMIAYAAVTGFGFGAYLSVDYVLITQVLPSSTDAAKDLGIINITATLPQTVAAAGAGLIITLFHSYTALFPIAAVLGVLGGLLLLPVRSVR